MRYVAFLRAINVGKRRIKMEDLRALYIGDGFQNVATYIASGNVIFDSVSPPVVSHIEEIFEDGFGFRSEVFLRTSDMITDVLERAPWEPGSGVVEVSFLEREPARRDATALERTALAPEGLAVIGTEVFFLRAGKGIPTVHKESTSIELLGMRMTRRSLTTVAAISERFL